MPCVLAMYYTLQVMHNISLLTQNPITGLILQIARNKDKVALTRVLGTLAVGHGERCFEDPFLHTLVITFFIFPMADYPLGSLARRYKRPFIKWNERESLGFVLVSWEGGLLLS